MKSWLFTKSARRPLLSRRGVTTLPSHTPFRSAKAYGCQIFIATRVDVLRELKITHIVSIYTKRPRFSKEYRTRAGNEQGFWCMHWNWDNKQRDLSPSELHEVQREVTGLLWERQHNPSNQIANVLIHSRTGCRRAAIVALSCVLPSMAPNCLFDAIAKLRTCRPGFKPDDHALSLLTRYMAYVGGSKPMKPNDPNRIHLNDLFQRIYPEYPQQRFGINVYQRPERMIEPQYERPLELTGQSSNFKKEESAIFSEVIVSDSDDGSTEVAEPADVGNALLGDLGRGSTLEVIHEDDIVLVHHNPSLHSSGGSFASNGHHSSNLPLL